MHWIYTLWAKCENLPSGGDLELLVRALLIFANCGAHEEFSFVVNKLIV